MKVACNRKAPCHYKTSNSKSSNIYKVNITILSKEERMNNCNNNWRTYQYDLAQKASLEDFLENRQLF